MPFAQRRGMIYTGTGDINERLGALSAIEAKHWEFQP
jgi:hypothetical protein